MTPDTLVHERLVQCMGKPVCWIHLLEWDLNRWSLLAPTTKHGSWQISIAASPVCVSHVVWTWWTSLHVIKCPSIQNYDFVQQITGYGGPLEWPQLSLYLTSMDSYLSAYIKHRFLKLIQFLWLIWRSASSLLISQIYLICSNVSRTQCYVYSLHAFTCTHALLCIANNGKKP